MRNRKLQQAGLRSCICHLKDAVLQEEALRFEQEGLPTERALDKKAMVKSCFSFSSSKAMKPHADTNIWQDAFCLMLETRKWLVLVVFQASFKLSASQ